VQLDLAAIFMDRGRFEEAEDLMKRVLRQTAQLHDWDQDLRIDTLTKLVTVYRCQRKLEEAEKLGIEVVETRAASQGDEHSMVLESKNNLGSVLMEMGKLSDAANLFTCVINAKEAQGIRDSVYSASKYCLVATYTAAEKWGDTVELGIEVLEITKRALGTGHPLWIRAADDVLLAYGNLKNVADFEDLKGQVLEAKKATWKEISIDQIHVFDTISSVLVQQESWAEAQEIEEQKLHILRELRGEDHSDTVASTGLLAWICEENDQWTKAERLKLEVVDKNRSTLGPDHEHTVRCMEDTVTFYIRRGDLENAEKLTLEVIEIRQRALGDSHHETIRTMSYLAAIMAARGKHVEAQRMEEACRLLRLENPS
jgi:tetratricopeptide (TPR) repeat protein